MEDRDRLGPRLYRRGLHGQSKTIVKTKPGTQDVAQFTVDNNIQCLKDYGYGELPEELGQEALDNYFDMRQGKAESILDYIFNTENFVPIVVPGLSSSSTGSSSTPRTPMKQESRSSSSSSSSSSSPTVGEIQVREREDATNSDISPVQVSNSVDDRSEQPDETTIERGNPSDSEIPEWLQEFRENLVDDEIP